MIFKTTFSVFAILGTTSFREDGVQTTKHTSQGSLWWSPSLRFSSIFHASVMMTVLNSSFPAYAVLCLGLVPAQTGSAPLTLQSLWKSLLELYVKACFWALPPPHIPKPVLPSLVAFLLLAFVFILRTFRMMYKWHFPTGFIEPYPWWCLLGLFGFKLHIMGQSYPIALNLSQVPRILDRA
jgi:hypothetical protein